MKFTHKFPLLGDSHCYHFIVFSFHICIYTHILLYTLWILIYINFKNKSGIILYVQFHKLLFYVTLSRTVFACHCRLLKNHTFKGGRAYLLTPNTKDQTHLLSHDLLSCNNPGFPGSPHRDSGSMSLGNTCLRWLASHTHPGRMGPLGQKDSILSYLTRTCRKERDLPSFNLSFFNSKSS
jgi:hypothetical protein